jgi:hypothetical protein
VPTDADTRAALARRNRLLHLLVRRVTLVRRTAARVFVRHPEILREVTSAYERRRRAVARREKARSDQAAKSAPKQASKAKPADKPADKPAEG